MEISDQNICHIKEDMAKSLFPDKGETVRFWDLLDEFFERHKKEESKTAQLELTVIFDNIISELMRRVPYYLTPTKDGNRS